MIDVSNGRLRSTTRNADQTTTYEWFVSSPINNYDVAVNAGNYAHAQSQAHGVSPADSSMLSEASAAYSSGSSSCRGSSCAELIVLKTLILLP